MTRTVSKGATARAPDGANQGTAKGMTERATDGANQGAAERARKRVGKEAPRGDVAKAVTMAPAPRERVAETAATAPMLRERAAKTATTTSPPPAPRTKPAAPALTPRALRQAKRREAILAAALDEFSARGFAATRLEDVARRAGIAKGTIYLYFRDKESLFLELVRSMLSPIVGRLEAAPMADLPARAIAEIIADLFVREIFGTRRKDVIRLIIAEGARFPNIAAFYYHEVIERVIAAMRALMQRAVARGELRSDALARFPQLLVAPGLVAVVWSGLFDRFAPLDVAELMRAHIDLLFGERSAS